jgi:HSP20 family protein
MHRYERSYGIFERTFALPTTVDPEKIDASSANGILTVTIPKAERARPREIPVKVS